MQRYQRSVQAFDDAVGRRLGLNPTDLRCLDWLADGPKTAGQLAEATGLRPAATTTLVDRLSRRGLVRRLPSETDRRQVLVEMTEQGVRAHLGVLRPARGRGPASCSPTSAPRSWPRMRDLLDAMRDLTDRHRGRVRADSDG